MTDQIKLACNACVYWRSQTPGDVQAPCNRYPGNVVSYPETRADFTKAQQGVQWKFTVMLPSKAPHEWCGEFQPRPVSPLQ